MLAGDARLIDKLRREELIPLGSRIRTRLATEHASREELLAGLNHLLAGAGNASLMTTTLRDVAVRRNAAADHAQRWLRSPSPNSISGPSNWVIALNTA